MPTKRKLAISILMTAVFSIMWHPTAANAATYYTATNGKDGNPGTQAQPFATIKKGLGILQPGDTLYLRAGTYFESISSHLQTIPAGTSWTNPVTVAAYPGETATIAGRGITIASPSVQYVVFRGDPGSYNLILDGQGASGNAFISVVNADGVAPRDSYVRFQNMEMKNSYDTQGVFIYANHVEVLNSKVHDVRTSSPTNGDVHCFYIQGAFTIIDGNDIYNCPTYGLHFYNGYDHTLAHDNVVRNNRVHNTSAGPYSGGGGGIIIGSGSNNLVYNNLVYDNPGGGIGVAYGGSGNSVYNNTIYNTGSLGTALDIQGVTNTIVKNNILYQNRYELITDNNPSTIFANNLCNNTRCEFSGDPKFVDAAAHDFHLQPTSPIINKGVSLSAVGADFDNTVRPQDHAYDLGAFEFKSGTAPASPIAPPTNVLVR